MKTFNEFYRQKLVNEAHKGTPQEFAKLGINPDSPLFFQQLAKMWLPYTGNEDTAHFMAKQGFIPDAQDKTVGGRKVGMNQNAMHGVEADWRPDRP
jgi:hypothetical protein